MSSSLLEVSRGRCKQLFAKKADVSHLDPVSATSDHLQGSKESQLQKCSDKIHLEVYQQHLNRAWGSDLEQPTGRRQIGVTSDWEVRNLVLLLHAQRVFYIFQEQL